MIVRPACALALATALLGCSSIGPDRVRSDQVEYGDAIGDAAKRQTLLNIVKLRFGDVPSLLTVGQVTQTYTLSGSAQVGADVLPGQSFSLGDDGTVGVGGTVTSQPSVVYRPLTGPALSQALLTPMKPAALFGLVAAGAADELALELGLKSIDGWQNELTTGRGVEPAAPEFRTAVTLIARLVQRGHLALAASGPAPAPAAQGPAQPPPPPAPAPALGVSAAEGEPALTAQQPTPMPATPAAPAVTPPRGDGLVLKVATAARNDPEVRRLREILDLAPDTMELPLVEGFGHERDGLLRLRTRSLIEVLNAAAIGVEVPEKAPARARATPLIGGPSPLLVRRSVTPPMSSFAAVRYAGDWYYVDAADTASRRSLAMVMLLADVAQPEPPK